MVRLRPFETVRKWSQTVKERRDEQLFSPNDYAQIAQGLLKMIGLWIVIFFAGFGLGAWIF